MNITHESYELQLWSIFGVQLPSPKYFHVFSKNKTLQFFDCSCCSLLLTVVKQHDEQLPSQAKKCISTQGLSILT